MDSPTERFPVPLISLKPNTLPVAENSILVVSQAGENTPWTMLLTERGFRVLHARGPEEAILLFAREPGIMVVAADLDSDHYNAAAVIETLRNHEQERDSVEYLLIAASGVSLATLRTVVNHISDILIKPGRPEQFADAVCDAVNVARMKRFQREEARALEAALTEFKMQTHAAISHLITQAQGACNIIPAALAPVAVQPDKAALQSFMAEESERARLREKIFGALVQNHAVWILLLVLWDASQAGTELTIKSAAYAAGLPLSSALRKINDMCAEGLIARRGDPDDARRSFVTLTPQGQGYFNRFFRIWNDANNNRHAAG